MDDPGDPILFDEYTMADALRVIGVTLPAMRQWMLNGTLQQGEWRVIPEARGPGPDRHGYMIRREAIARVAAARGRPCNWAAARSAQATPQLADLIRQLRSRIESLEAENQRLRMRVSREWRYGAELADVMEAEDAGTHHAPANGHSAPVARSRADAVTLPARRSALPAGTIGHGRQNTLPAHLTSCSAFASDHGFLKHQHVMWREAIREADERHQAGELSAIVIRGDWKVHNSSTKTALDRDGRIAFVQRFSRNSFWKRCGRPDCPCADPALYPSPEQFERAGAYLPIRVPAVPVLG